MRLALRLATKGRGQTAPNPLVGALVVQGQHIVGKGYHQKAGAPHAEVLALREAGSKARGATLYVTLEPCSHRNKRTPPCVPMILQSEVKRVIIAMRDPNPEVNGRGIRLLQKNGVLVEVGCLQRDAERLNEFYCHWIQTNRPFVFLKSAMSLDGKIATAKGESQWITGQPARALVHNWRSQVDAVMVGIGTVLRDNPSMTARRGGEARGTFARHQPLRIVVDSQLRIPLQAKILARGKGENPPPGSFCQSLIVTTQEAPKNRVHRLQSLKIPILVVPSQKGRPSLSACMKHLGKMGISSVMIEGGGELNAAALEAGVVNQVRMFIAPKILGGQNAKSVIGGLSPARLGSARELSEVQIRKIGSDFLIEADIASPTSPKKKKARR